MFRRTLQAISWIAILGTILPPVGYLAGVVTLSACHTQMLVATIVWFVATPLWMGREPQSSPE